LHRLIFSGGPQPVGTVAPEAEPASARRTGARPLAVPARTGAKGRRTGQVKPKSRPRANQKHSLQSGLSLWWFRLNLAMAGCYERAAGIRKSGVRYLRPHSRHTGWKLANLETNRTYHLKIR